MSADRLIASAALIVAAVALAVAAFAWRDTDERDACAKLADLGGGVGIERAFFLTGNEEPDVPTLLTECLKDS